MAKFVEHGGRKLNMGILYWCGILTNFELSADCDFSKLEGML
jgi:hypothetical protein